MSETSPSAAKTISWLLLILLFGTVALLVWYEENRSKVIADKDVHIAQAGQLAAETEQKLAQSKEVSNVLRSEKQELMGKLDAANQTQQALQGEMKALEAQHAKILAAEQDKARQVNTELQGQRDAAEEQVAALGAEVSQLEQKIADAAAEHEAQSQQLEHRMNEKVDRYRVALEGSEPERAAQLVGLELQVQESQKTADEALQAGQAIQTKAQDLEAQLARANQAITEKDRVLSEKEQTLEAVRADLAQEQSAHEALQQKHEGTVARTTEALTKLQQKFDAARAAHEKTKTEAAAEMQSAKKSHAARMTEAEGKISDLTARLQAETTALGILQQEHEAMGEELRGSLAATEQKLAGVEAELRQTRESEVQAKQIHEQQIAEAESKISGLEQTLERTRETAAQDLASSRREGEEAVAYIRRVYTDFAKLEGHHTDQGMLLSLAEDDLRFRISKTELPDDNLPSLDRIAEILVKYPELMVRIEGHTDSKGSDETNLELSLKRADEVRQALVDRGVDPERISTIGVGEARPIADNASSAGRRKNRRVEVYVLESPNH